MKRLYSAFVRPHLDCGVQLWSPGLINDQNLREKIQRRATKIPMFRHLPVDERLERLDVFLKKAKGKSGLFEVFRILNRLESINTDNQFQRNPNTMTRSRGLSKRETDVTHCRVELLSIIVSSITRVDSRCQ